MQQGIFTATSMSLSGHASQPSIYISTILFTVLSCIVVALRLITRLSIVRQTGWDDLFITISCILSVAMGISICEQAHYGMGLHVATITTYSLETARKWFWNFFWLYYGSLCFTKLSIVLQYLRIFPQVAFTRACYALLAIVSMWSCWAIFSAIFNCSPISRFWTEPVWDGRGCLPRFPLWYTNAAVTITTDIATVVLPMPVVRTLEIPRHHRTIVMCVFAVGLFTCLVSILRMVFIYPLSISPDITWHSPLVAIWSCVEANTAILCSCVPTLKGLTQRFFPKVVKLFRSTPVVEITGSSTNVSKGSNAVMQSSQKGDIELEVIETSFKPSKRSRRFIPSINRTSSRRLENDSRSDASEEAIIDLGSRSDGPAWQSAHIRAPNDNELREALSRSF